MNSTEVKIELGLNQPFTINPLASGLPLDVCSALVHNHLNLVDRASLRSTCLELRRNVDGVITSLSLKLDRLQSNAGLNTDWERVTLLQNMSSLTHVCLRHHPKIITSDLEAFVESAGPSLVNRLQQLSFRSCPGSDCSATPLDFSPLAACPHLTDLELAGLHVRVDLTGLQRISRLKCLELGWQSPNSQCAVGDLSPLTRCASLQRLVIKSCENIEDFSPLALCTELRHLELLGCINLYTMHPFATCALLEHLVIDGFGSCGGQISRYRDITDISPLASCAMLKHMRMICLSKLQDISPLSACKKLIDLDLDACPSLVDISPISSCTQLQHLKLSYCTRLINISPIASCTLLEDVDLSVCYGLTNLSSLASCPLLKHLDLRFCGITGISPLSACQELQVLILRNCDKICDVSPLTGCTKLRKVGLTGCPAHAQAEQILRPGVAQW